MRRQKTTKTRIVLLGSLTLIAVTFWIGNSIYESINEDRISPEVKVEITPLNPTLDLQVLDEIEQKNYIEIDFPDDEVVENTNY